MYYVRISAGSLAGLRGDASLRPLFEPLKVAGFFPGPEGS
jgi:hypothetical protein